MATVESIDDAAGLGGPERQRSAFSQEWVKLPRTDLPRRYLKAGDLMICRTACEVTTVLGSCVAVTFYSARLGLGGICHAMLPAPRPRDEAGELRGAHRWKYVRYAVEELVQCFTQPGLAPGSVEVKLFGGACVLTGSDEAREAASVGAHNVALTRSLLDDAGFPVLACDVGGHHGRKVVFNTQTGVVHVKLLDHV